MPEILVHIGAILLGFISYTIIMCYIFWNVGFNAGFNNGVKTGERMQRTRTMNNCRENSRPATQKSVDLNNRPIDKGINYGRNR